MRTTCLLLAALTSWAAVIHAKAPPNVVLVMADDQGWGQTGYYNHPVLKTPHLDAMAANGLRFDRFYAGGPVCSPTRATVLTGRTHDRTGVFDHGFALRDQEKPLPRAMKAAGYATGHFGKWHLNGLRGPGVPILGDDSHNPGAFGFDTWLSVTNFFDLDPVMSRQGKFESFKGDSSEIIVDEALKFIGHQVAAEKPFFTVIWYGTPHSPWMALSKDEKPFGELSEKSQKHYGELVAMDRSIGALRKGLRKLKVADDTLLWFTSDNGGLPGFTPPTTGGLRNFKGSMYEGGLRVPAILEWPNGIKPRITNHPAGAVDIFPTLAEIVGLPSSAMLQPQDGLSLVSLLAKESGPRTKSLIFRSRNRMAIIDNDWKLLSLPGKGGRTNIELYNLANDRAETTSLLTEKAELADKLGKQMATARKSIEASVQGKDYPGGKLNPQPPRIFWTELDAYRPYFKDWKNRPEYQSRLKKIVK